MNFLIKLTAAFVMIFTFKGTYAEECRYKEKFVDGHRQIEINGIRLVDVESFKILDRQFIFALSPIYGKPKIGVIDCKTKKIRTLVKAKNFLKGYPHGADFFRIKEVSKVGDEYRISYFYSKNVDAEDFKNFEIKENVHEITFK